MDVIIRDNEPQDLPPLTAIAIRAFTPVFDGFQKTLGPELYRVVFGDNWQKDKAAEVERKCRGEDNARVAVALVDGRQVGFAAYYIHPGDALGVLCLNAVDPDLQNRGIATRLYQYALQQMRSAGVQYVKVGTGLDEASAPARHAYQKVGFSKALPGVEYFMKL